MIPDPTMPSVSRAIAGGYRTVTTAAQAANGRFLRGNGRWDGRSRRRKRM
jgi:hypothetical protein